MKVDIQIGVPPPEDIQAFPPWLQPVGQWVRYSTPHAHAYVFEGGDVTGARSYLLHWIESDEPGAGEASQILQVIGLRGDQRRASGSLVCDPDLVGWYARFGWVPFDRFGEYAVMARFYDPDRHAP